MWLIAGLTALVIALFAFGRSRLTGFHRFVSQPLSDGTRFSFLYPEYLSDVVETPGGGSPEVVHSVSVYNRAGEHPYDVNRTPWGTWWRKIGLSHAENITVVVIPIETANMKDNRSSKEWISGWERRRNEYLDDARSRLRFELYYSCAKDAPQFKSHSRIIAESFRVLAAGAGPTDP